MSEMVERVVKAIDHVVVCFHTNGSHPLRWTVMHQYGNPDGEYKIIYVGRDRREGDNLSDPPGDVWYALKEAKARAAIEEMREPTEAMVMAAYRDHSCDTTEVAGERVHDMVDLRECWKTMIDAALTK